LGTPICDFAVSNYYCVVSASDSLASKNAKPAVAESSLIRRVESGRALLSRVRTTLCINSHLPYASSTHLLRRATHCPSKPLLPSLCVSTPIFVRATRRRRTPSYRRSKTATNLGLFFPSFYLDS